MLGATPHRSLDLFPFKANLHYLFWKKTISSSITQGDKSLSQASPLSNTNEVFHIANPIPCLLHKDRRQMAVFQRHHSLLKTMGEIPPVISSI